MNAQTERDALKLLPKRLAALPHAAIQTLTKHNGPSAPTISSETWGLHSLLIDRKDKQAASCLQVNSDNERSSVKREAHAKDKRAEVR